MLTSSASIVSKFGARDLIIGTIVTSFGAVILAAPVSIAIGLFLSELAPPAIRGPIGTLIEMLAAVPSVVIGLWGIFVLGPFMRSICSRSSRDSLVDPPLRARRDRSSRPLPGHPRPDDHDHPDHVVDLPRAVRRACRRDLKEAALGLGADSLGDGEHRRRAVRAGGVVAAIILGLGRALGEAIAVTQVIGNSSSRSKSRSSRAGDTLASQHRRQLPERADEHRGGIAPLPGTDPARDHLHRPTFGAQASSSASSSSDELGTPRTSRYGLPAAVATPADRTASPSYFSRRRAGGDPRARDPRRVGVLPRRATP